MNDKRKLMKYKGKPKKHRGKPKKNKGKPKKNKGKPKENNGTRKNNNEKLMKNKGKLKKHKGKLSNPKSSVARRVRFPKFGMAMVVDQRVHPQQPIRRKSLVHTRTSIWRSMSITWTSPSGAASAIPGSKSIPLNTGDRAAKRMRWARKTSSPFDMRRVASVAVPSRSNAPRSLARSSRQVRWGDGKPPNPNQSIFVIKSFYLKQENATHTAFWGR